MKKKSGGVGFDFSVFVDYDQNSDVRLYEIGSYRCKPGYAFGPSIRPRGIVHYVLSGKGSLYLQGKEHPVKADQIFYIPAGTSAYYEADADNPWHYAWAHIGGSVVTEALSNAGIDEHNPVKDIIKIDNENVFKKLVKEISEGIDRENYCIGKMYEIIDYFERAYGVPPKSPESIKLEYVNTVIKFIQLKYSEPIKVDYIATACGLNRSYLSRLFHDATGSTIQDYLTNYRMSTAEMLLKTTEHSIQYISCAVGYSDIYTFSKAFKKRTGMSPTGYRLS